MLYFVTDEDLKEFSDADLVVSLGRVRGAKRAGQIEPTESLWARWRQIQKALHQYLSSGKEWDAKWLGKYRKTIAAKQQAQLEAALQAFGEQLIDPSLVPSQFVSAYRRELEGIPEKRAALVQLLALASDPKQQVVVTTTSDDSVFLIPIIEFAQDRKLSVHLGTQLKTQPYHRTQGRWAWRHTRITT